MRIRVSFCVVLIALGNLMTGCATTRTAQLGSLPTNESLVTLLVTKDRTLVQVECRDAVVFGPILGCQRTRVTTLPNGQPVRVVKIVRYTDTLPSQMAFEIDLHELCHTVATVQAVPDPCHQENLGVLHSSPLTLGLRH